MLEIVLGELARPLDRLGECQAVGQAGQAVAKHLGAKRAIGLDLHRPVDDAQEAARLSAIAVRQRRELDPEMARGEAVAVAEIQLAVDVCAGEIAVDEIGDRPRLEAFRVTPVRGSAGRLLDQVEESAVVRRHLERAGGFLPDDRRGNRKGVEQAGIVRPGVRHDGQIVRLPLLPRSRQTVYCSLHRVRV